MCGAKKVVINKQSSIKQQQQQNRPRSKCEATSQTYLKHQR